ncbi:UNVERIFIED_CONTAM: hypothetical protein Sradi_6243300 [Sesamum radiatum]|uniref:RNase H type-1 domain-containing protein n=1 Tax=Sesamum radiatum TaxID=300843 RepID=A0AAW2KA70_SESRA
MMRPNASGHLIKWAVGFGEFDIEYQSKLAVKAQVFADFVVELVGEQEEQRKESWMLHVDGSSTSNAGGAEILHEPGGVEIEVTTKLDFPTTNNKAEYEDLTIGLKMALDAGIRELDVYMDSQLVAMQIDGSYEMREWSITRYLKKVKDLMSKFDKCIIKQILRDENTRADTFSKFGTMVTGVKERKIIVMVKDRASVEEVEVVQCVMEEKSWKSEMDEYLVRGAKSLRANRFTMVNGKLYRRSA